MIVLTISFLCLYVSIAQIELTDEDEL